MVDDLKDKLEYINDSGEFLYRRSRRFDIGRFDINSWDIYYFLDHCNTIHRTNGPAIETSSGYIAFVQNNKYHNEIGWALQISPTSAFEYWLDDKLISFEEWQRDPRVIEALAKQRQVDSMVDNSAKDFYSNFLKEHSL